MKTHARHHMLLIPARGDAKRLDSDLSDPALMAAEADRVSAELFAGQHVEIVIIHTLTNTAVINRMARRSPRRNHTLN